MSIINKNILGERKRITAIDLSNTQPPYIFDPSNTQPPYMRINS